MIADSPCPKTGDGVHSWIMSRARQLSFPTRNQRDPITSPEQARITIEAEIAAANCGRRVSLKEIDDAVNKAYSTTNQSTRQGAIGPGSGYKSPIPRVQVDKERIAQLCQQGPTEQELEALSPDPTREVTELYTDHLFRYDELLCAAVGGPWNAQTRSRKEWGEELSSTALIVPSPMSSRRGVNDAGASSVRCNDNTGPRRFLVIEGDATTADEQAAVLYHLSKFKPLVMVVHSGRRSLHGWFDVRSESEEAVRKLMAYAQALGGDGHTLVRCQMIRTPGGIRDNQARQHVIYFNQEVAR